MKDWEASDLVREEAMKIGYGSIKQLLAEASHREIRGVIERVILKVAARAEGRT